MHDRTSNTVMLLNLSIKQLIWYKFWYPPWTITTSQKELQTITSKFRRSSWNYKLIPWHVGKWVIKCPLKPREVCESPSALPQTSFGFWGHLITSFPHVMVLLIIKKQMTYTGRKEQLKPLAYRAYSWGYGEEYHVVISYEPNWM